MYKTENLLDLNHTITKEHFKAMCLQMAKSETGRAFYTPKFWEDVIEYIAKQGFLKMPHLNDPWYIVNTIACDGTVTHFNDIAYALKISPDDTTSIINYADENRLPVCDHYLVEDFGFPLEGE